MRRRYASTHRHSNDGTPCLSYDGIGLTSVGRGPLGGFSRTAEDRAVAAEDALAWLLSKREVQELLESLDGTVSPLMEPTITC